MGHRFSSGFEIQRGVAKMEKGARLGLQLDPRLIKVPPMMKVRKYLYGGTLE